MRAPDNFGRGSRSPYGRLPTSKGGRFSNPLGGGQTDWRDWLPYIIGGIVVILVIWILLTENLFVVIGGTLLMAGLSVALGAAATAAFMGLFPLLARLFGMRLRNK